MWCIPPEGGAHFVCQMESVLEVYKRPHDPRYPVICMDETSKQCTREVRTPIAANPGATARYDAEYERNGVAHLMAFYAPFENWRRVDVADNHAAKQWAEGVRRLVQEDYPEARKITLVMDNLNTHTGASLYKAFVPELASALLDKLAFVYTPKHGSWLNRAECEFSVLSRQCLDRRLPDRDTVNTEVSAWVEERNLKATPADWRFTTEDARIKLKRLYPNIND
jgi:transposase